MKLMKVKTRNGTEFLINVEATTADLKNMIPRVFFKKMSGRENDSYTYGFGCVIASYIQSDQRTEYHVPYLVNWETGNTVCLKAGCKYKDEARQIIREMVAAGTVV